jgi:hypothetical protein
MSPSFSPSMLLLAFDRHSVSEAISTVVQPSIPMYTPRWYALRVLDTTAHDWWKDGLPPVKGRRQRARQAMAGLAAGVVRRVQAQRGRKEKSPRSEGAQTRPRKPQVPR